MTPTQTTTGPSAHTPLREALRGAASALKENGPRFALAGSYALWAYGATEPSHDVDLVVAESDVANAVATRPTPDSPSSAPGGLAVQGPRRRYGRRCAAPAQRCARGAEHAGPREQHDVLAIRMPVLPRTMVLTQQLRALSEHHCDFAKLLPAVRAVHEQLNWPRIRTRTADNDYAVAFLVLADRLGPTG